MELLILIIASLLIVLCSLYMGYRLYKKADTNFDMKIKDWVKRYHNTMLFGISKRITKLGNVESLIIIAIPILFVLVRGDDYLTATSIIVSAGLAIIVSQLMKFAFRRSRPMKRTEFNQIGYSFPSGHATVGMSFYVTLAYIVSHGSSKMPMIMVIGLIIGLSIAFSRIFLGVHWATDVIVGIFLGLMCACWAIYLYRNGYILNWIFALKAYSPEHYFI